MHEPALRSALPVADNERMLVRDSEAQAPFFKQHTTNGLDDALQLRSVVVIDPSESTLANKQGGCL